jgi:hypothetical protein
LLQIIKTSGSADHLGGWNIQTQGKWLFISSVGTPIGSDSPEPMQDLSGSISIYKFHEKTGRWEFKQLIDKTLPGLENLTPSSPEGLNVTLPAFLNQQGASFGLTFSVDVKRGLMLVGAQYQQHTDSIDNTLINSGSVFALKLIDDKWTFLQEIVNPDGSFANDTFGANVVMYDDLAIISNTPVAQQPRLTIPPYINPPLPNTNGTAYVYQFRHNQWHLVQKLMSDQTNPGNIPFTPMFCLCQTTGCAGFPCPYICEVSDNFGSSLAMNDKWAVIGAGLEQVVPNGPLSGAVYFYHIEKNLGIKQLVKKQKVVSDDPTTQGTAILSLAIHDDIVVITDPLHTGPQGEQQQGALLVYELKNCLWTKKATLFDPKGGSKGYFGFGAYATDHYIIGGASTFTSALLFFEFGNPIIPLDFPLQDGSAVIYKRVKK